MSTKSVSISVLNQTNQPASKPTSNLQAYLSIFYTCSNDIHSDILSAIFIGKMTYFLQHSHHHHHYITVSSIRKWLCKSYKWNWCDARTVCSTIVYMVIHWHQIRAKTAAAAASVTFPYFIDNLSRENHLSE